MSEDINEGASIVVYFLCFVLGLIAAGVTFYNLDSDRDALDACSAKLERDRYCVMIAVPSEYRLTLKEEEANE